MAWEIPRFVQRLLNHWKSNGVAFLPGVSDKALAEAEQRYGVLPESLKELYRATNGTEVPGSMLTDERHHCFLRLDHCYTEQVSPRVLIFVDWLDGAQYYGIQLGDRDEEQAGRGGTVFLVLEADLKVADTLEEFVDLYIADDMRLQPIGARRYNGLPDERA